MYVTRQNSNFCSAAKRPCDGLDETQRGKLGDKPTSSCRPGADLSEYTEPRNRGGYLIESDGNFVAGCGLQQRCCKVTLQRFFLSTSMLWITPLRAHTIFEQVVLVQDVAGAAAWIAAIARSQDAAAVVYLSWAET